MARALLGETFGWPFMSGSGGAGSHWYVSRPRKTFVDTFLLSTGAVAIAEIGDKTQLLALALGARFRAPLPIILGILIATAANHLGAAFAGTFAAALLSAESVRWILAASFLGMALWCLIPDRLDSEANLSRGLGAFGTTLIAFFLVEMGDKTQIATVALAAQFHSVLAVATGTTLGMMIANVPVVYAGRAIAGRVNLRAVRMAAAILFLVLCVAVLWA